MFVWKGCRLGYDWSYKEKELLSKIQEGDERAFTVLVMEYAPIIYSHILSYLKDVQIAEELTQDVFVGIWNLRQSLTTIENFRSYLFKAARNRTISALRQQLNNSLNLEGRDDWEDVIANPISRSEYRELYDSIQEGIEQLPPRRKLVFKLSRMEGLSYDEIAQRLSISRSAVNQHIVESLVFLRAHLHKKSLIWIILFISPQPPC